MEPRQQIMDWIEVETKELAEQMTLIDFNLISKIKLEHLFSKSWQKEESPVKMAIHHFNQVSQWVASEIILAANRRQCAERIKKFISLTFVSLSHTFLPLTSLFPGVIKIAQLFWNDERLCCLEFFSCGEIGKGMEGCSFLFSHQN